MNRNVGTIDRALRVAVGVVLIALVFVGPQTPFGWIGLVPLITALIGWCPLYRLVGLNSCRLGKQA
jgi:Inner membrane protein YgaP-like, transmembrane domain